MIRPILRALNGPILILLVAIGMALQSSLFYPWPLPYLQPDLALIVILWCAFRRGFEEGGIITLVIANMTEIHSAAPQGLFLISYMCIYLLMRGASRLIVLLDVKSFAFTAMISTLIWKFIGWTVLSVLGNSLAGYWKSSITTSLLSAVVECVVSLVIYKWMERFDWITYKSVQSEQALQRLNSQFRYERGIS